MNSTVESLEDNKVKLSVEVDADEFEVEVEKAFKKVARDVRLPGFRQGKVPRRVLEARFGSGIARGQALEDSIPEFFMTALSEHEIDIINAPDYEIISGEEDGPLHFDATVEIRPQVTISGYENLQVEIPNPDPSDEEVQSEVDSFLGQFAELASVERSADDDDTVTMDIATSYQDEEIEGLTAADYSYRVGTGAVVAELDENLRGASIGDVLEFQAVHPDPEEDGSLAFRIEVKDIQEQVLPELTDEIVADASDFSTAEDFRTDVRTRLVETKRAQADAMWREKAAEALGALVTDDPPAALVDTEVRNRVEDMARRLSQSGLQFEQYLQMVGQSIDDVFEQMREPAVESVRVDLALRSLAVAEGLEASDEDLDGEFDQLAEGTGMSLEELRKQISTPNQLMLMKADITKRNAADWLLDRVEVVDEDGNVVDTEALEPEPQDQEDDHAHDHHDGEEE